MTLPSNHILPPSSFFHIGVMVVFMYYMAAFSLLGFLSVNDIAKGWMSDIKDSLNIEIPSFDPENKTVFQRKIIEENAVKIRNYLARDPLVTSVDITQVNSIKTQLEELDIPAPTFINITLNENRAVNSEQRLLNNIKNLVPSIIIHQQEEWEVDIRHIAFVFQTIFCGLALSIVIITSIVLSAVIRTQLKASDETVKLVHLMGTQVKTIAALFKSSVSRAVTWGILLGGTIAATSLTGLLEFLNLTEKLNEFYFYLGAIAFVIIFLCRGVTHLTVISSLKGMP